MSMEIELPDPASIWKELGEFQSAVDSYAKQQTELADRLRKSHLEFCQTQKGKLDSVEVKKNKALHDIEVLVEAKQKEKEELDRMKKKNSTLSRESGELPAKLEQSRSKDEEQLKRVSITRGVLEKKERVQRREIEERKNELGAFERALGLNIRKDSAGYTHFKFTHVDDMDLEAQFEFVISDAAESGDVGQIVLVSCMPALDNAQSFIDSYNKSKHPSKLSTLVRIFRREFQASISRDQ